MHLSWCECLRVALVALMNRGWAECFRRAHKPFLLLVLDVYGFAHVVCSPSTLVKIASTLASCRL